MSKTTQRIIAGNGIHINIAEQGEGPLVLLVHGFPESWYSWRRQIDDLAAAGFRVVAPDMRGYGKSDAPQAIDQYTTLHLVGDMVGILDALGESHAVIVGHDWGASVAWQAALTRPDRFRAIAALSVPFRPRGKTLPTSLMPRTENAQFYQLYFQEPGKAEAELERDPRATIRNMLFGASGDGVAAARAAAAAGGPAPNLGMVPKGGGFLQGPGAPATLPSWITEADIDFYGEQFKRSGFRGALNYYRNIDRNWEITGALSGLQVNVPALYIAGDRDFIVAFPGTDQLLANMKGLVPGLRGIRMLPGCGHWTQQERPNDVSAALIEFVRALPSRS
ncbi:alpha/beta fold hydrolase [Bradyrhizobium sp. CCBAU 11357]|uniref:alpha/beta fold hydrolase n=1 Tax=Bradyrhizobium sp. CCBAU 11357 TaxID=1630808 RepID=UPI002302438A|nr:alpha/beta hydrolase [Bradyrhizobium sp. CCBAU 11357]MDA9497096.1 epoxide hydrolase [Bradyrhizobium sp. CCBAU 11357]